MIAKAPIIRFNDEQGNNFSDWEEKPFYQLLDDVLDFRGRTPLKLGMDWGGGDVKSLSANNVKNGYIDFSAECNLGSEALYDRWMGGVSLAKGDIVFTMEAPLGKALQIPDEQKYILSQRVVVFKTKKNVNNGFLLQLIWSAAYQAQLLRLATGSTAKGINQKSLKKVIAPLPTLPEQRKIADFLTAVDGRIGQLIQKKALLEDYKKGVMQQLFTQAIRFKDDHGNDFPEWEDKKLGDLGTVVGGGTPDSTKAEYWNGDVEWFTPSEIRSKYAQGSRRKITQAGQSNCSASFLPVGTLLMTSRATIAEVSISTMPCTTNQGFQSITANSQNSNEFIYYFILQFKKEFLRKSQGSTFLEIGGKEVRKIRIERPSHAEQTKIADFLSALDRKIESVATQITETQTFKRGLLQQMFV